MPVKAPEVTEGAFAFRDDHKAILYWKVSIKTGWGASAFDGRVPGRSKTKARRKQGETRKRKKRPIDEIYRPK